AEAPVRPRAVPTALSCAPSQGTGASPITPPGRSALPRGVSTVQDPGDPVPGRSAVPDPDPDPRPRDRVLSVSATPPRAWSPLSTGRASVDGVVRPAGSAAFESGNGGAAGTMGDRTRPPPLDEPVAWFEFPDPSNGRQGS